MNIVFFNNSSVDLYFFVENKGKPLCLIRQKNKFFLKSNFFQYLTFVFFTLIFLCKIIKYNSNQLLVYIISKKKILIWALINI
jgi:hypothetical protein